MKRSELRKSWWYIALWLVPVLALAQVDRSRGGRVAESALLDRYVVQAGDPSNVQIVPDPAGSGKSVLLMHLRSSDAKVSGGSRTEIVPKKEYVKGGVRWYAISFYLPRDWEFANFRTVVGQLHTTQKGGALYPPVAVVVQDRHLELRIRSRPHDSEEPVTQKSSLEVLKLGTAEPERWYCFVIRAVWSPKREEGALDVWMNGRKVYEASNLAHAYDPAGHIYPKAGLYIPGRMPIAERKIFTDFIHVGGPKSTLSEMMALTPCGS